MLEGMKLNRTRPWRRLARLRAARRRGTDLPLPDGRKDTPLPLPPLEPPDDDREFLVLSLRPGLRVEAA